MKWYEIYHSTSKGTWDVYEVTGNGQHYMMVKIYRTEAAAKKFGTRHWVKRWIEE